MPSPLTSFPAGPDPFNLGRTLLCLRMGVADPCWRSWPDGSRSWATRTPEGPVTLRLSPGDPVTAEAWGDGAEWVQQLLSGLLGTGDQPSVGARGGGPRELLARFPGFRLARSLRVVDAALAGVCRRGVSSFEAGRSWSLLVDAFGDDAPGPGGLRLPPAPCRLAAAEPYDLHVLGLEQPRADEARRIASHAPRLEVGPGEAADVAIDRLRAIAGLGADAVDHARSVALGAPDALPVIDAHHRAALVALLGNDRRKTADLETLLEEHRPERGRVVRLVGLTLEPAPGPH